MCCILHAALYVVAISLCIINIYAYASTASTTVMTYDLVLEQVHTQRLNNVISYAEQLLISDIIQNYFKGMQRHNMTNQQQQKAANFLN